MHIIHLENNCTDVLLYIVYSNTSYTYVRVSNVIMQSIYIAMCLETVSLYAKNATVKTTTTTYFKISVYRCALEYGT